MWSEAPGRSARRTSAKSVSRCGRSGAALIDPWRCTSSRLASSAGSRDGRSSVSRCVHAAGTGAWAGTVVGRRRGRCRHAGRRRPLLAQGAQRGRGPHRVAGARDVLVEDIDLPQRLVRIRDPELGLLGVAALHAVLALGAETGQLEAALDGDQFLGVADAQAGVVQVPVGGRASRNQREHERRLGQVELGVVVLDLGRLDAEQHPVEGHRRGDVGDVQRGVELHQCGVNRGRHASSRARNPSASLCIRRPLRQSRRRRGRRGTNRSVPGARASGRQLRM